MASASTTPNPRFGIACSDGPQRAIAFNAAYPHFVA